MHPGMLATLGPPRITQRLVVYSNCASPVFFTHRPYILQFHDDGQEHHVTASSGVMISASSLLHKFFSVVREMLSVLALHIAGLAKVND